MKLLSAIIAILLIGAGVMFWINHNSRTSELGPIEESEQKGQFGSDRVKDGKDAKPVAFDGKRAMKYLTSICDLGPRISGSRAMKKQQELIKKHFEDLGAKVAFQTFEAKQNSV